MSLIEILLLLVAIGAGFFAYLKVQKAKDSQDKLSRETSLKEAFMKEAEMYRNTKFQLEDSNKELQSLYDNANKEIQNLHQVMKEHGDDFREIQSLYDNAKDEIRQLSQRNDELSKSNFDPKPVRLEDLQYELEYKGEISWSSLEINIALLIADNKLFDVFKKLLNSNLLPESIQEQIDFQLDGLTVVIWCQNFDEEGTPIRSLTWLEIIEQIINKKRIITDYLNGVIQESNRAMVVHQALYEKPRKEVASA